MNDLHEVNLTATPNSRIMVRCQRTGSEHQMVATRGGRARVSLPSGDYVMRADQAETSITVDARGRVAIGGEKSGGKPARSGFVILAENPVWPGGAERWMTHLAQLATVPCVGVVFAKPVRSFNGLERKLQRWTRVSGGSKAVAEAIERAAVIVHYHNSWAPTFLRRDTPDRPKVIQVIHAPPEDPHCHGLIRKPKIPVDAYVAVSKAAARVAPPGSNVVVIPNAVDDLDPSQDTRLFRQFIGLRPDSRVALFLGRLSPEKKPDFALDVAAALPESWQVVIAGDGSMYDRLAAMVARNSVLRGKVLLPGTVDSAMALSIAECVLVPSMYESFCYTIAEAWKARVPVAATRVGLAEEHPEWVYPIDSEPSMTEALDVAAWMVRGADREAAFLDDAAQFITGECSMSLFHQRWTDILLPLVNVTSQAPEVPTAIWKCSTCGWLGLDLSIAEAPEYHHRWNSKQGMRCPGNLSSERHSTPEV